MNYSNHKSGAAELIQWLGENYPHILKLARSFSSSTDFHQYMRGVSGVTTEYFDSHGHACLAYLDAMRRMYAPVPRGVPVEDKPAENLGELLRRALNPGLSHSTPATQAKQDEPSKTPLFDHLRRLRESGQGPAAVEAPRPALTWADSKRVDRFPGFVVTSGECDLHRPYEGLIHPLQRIAQEGDQLHGSAFLRKG
jgi:hypothetical protein